MSDAEVAVNTANEAQRKAAEREAKKAEVRRRLEEAGSKSKKAKKGFLTPERKKKLRKLLMVKAAEDLKRQQLEKEKDRQRILSERTIALPDLDSIDDKGKLEAIFKDLEARVFQLESDKWDINRNVAQRDADINALTIEVNDLRGKYVKPALKKVSKYDNKFKKAGAAASQGDKQDFRASLKVVKKNVMEEIMNVAKKEDDKPDWSKKAQAAEETEEPKEVKEEKPKEEHEEAKKEEELPSENQDNEEGEDEEEEEDEE